MELLVGTPRNRPLPQFWSSNPERTSDERLCLLSVSASQAPELAVARIAEGEFAVDLALLQSLSSKIELRVLRRPFSRCLSYWMTVVSLYMERSGFTMKHYRGVADSRRANRNFGEGQSRPKTGAMILA
jgi:hypothetical protein